MRLTRWTDYSLRVLMYCAACATRERPATIREIAEAHRISRSHLTKVAMMLSNLGWLESTRGRGGGLRLRMPAQDIVVGTLVRQTATDFTLVECFDPARNTCRLDGHCRLKGVLAQALDSYLAVLDGVTLADLVAPLPASAGARHATRIRLVPGLPKS